MDDLLKIQEIIEDKKRQKALLEGRLESALETLKSFGVKNIKEAQRLLAKKKKELQKLEEQYERELEIFKEEYAEELEQFDF